MRSAIIFVVLLSMPPVYAGYLASTPDSLFIQASEGSIYFQEDVEPARLKLVEMAQDSTDTASARATIDYLVSILGTEHPREYHALRNLFPRIGKPAVPALIEALQGDSLRAVILGIEVLGRIKDSTAVQPLLAMVHHPQWNQKSSLRSNTYTALGRIGDHRATAFVMQGMNDEKELVRKAAAFGLRELRDPTAIPVLIDHLNDPFFGVRYPAAQALIKMDSLAVEPVLQALQNPASDPVTRSYLIEVLKATGLPDHLLVIFHFLEAEDPFIRGFAVDALAPYTEDPSVKAHLNTLEQMETNPFVRSQLEKISRLQN
ncbi:MAG: HEAT repeat domain-containing protein [Gemmatimonadetes bacterium]|nr:MAG: HEAT repeat domain-containing protein [Gemmatimonadota bacterium]